MTRRRALSAVEIMLAGWIFCGLFVATSSLDSYALVHLSLGLVVVGNLAVGVLLALLAIELKRLMIEVVIAAILAPLFFLGLVISPAAVAPPFLNQLSSYGITQSVAVFFLSLFPGLIGAMIGTVINSSVRGYEL